MGLREYQINIYNLSNKLHEFEFEISDELFQNQPHSLVEKGKGKCDLKLVKSETMMDLQFHIEAEVELTCDRSLELFWHSMTIDDSIIIKFGEDDYSLSEDVFVIRKDSSSINVSDFIYEFVSLAVPMKKLHPRFEEEDDEDQPDLIYTSQEESEDQSETDSEQVDPRWEALKKLKD